MSIKSQLLKVILKDFMLSIIAQKNVYGYELLMKLQKIWAYC